MDLEAELARFEAELASGPGPQYRPPGPPGFQVRAQVEPPPLFHPGINKAQSPLVSGEAMFRVSHASYPFFYRLIDCVEDSMMKVLEPLSES
jgi:hypothetical protein